MSEIWKNYVVNDKIKATPDLSPIILSSWQRSKSYNVNHESAKDAGILSISQLRERLLQNEELLIAAEKVLLYIYNLVKGKNNMVILCDRYGYILKVLGDPPFINKAYRVQLSPGACWHEEYRGTNAIGTALYANMPVKVLGWEHYVKKNHFLSCWAAPILGHDKEFYGILNISGDCNQKDNGYLEYALIGSKMIEQNLLIEKLKKQIKICNENFKLLNYLVNCGLIQIDDNGLIKKIHYKALKILNKSRQELISRSVEEVFNLKKGKLLSITDKNDTPEGPNDKYVILTDNSGYSQNTLDKRRDFFGLQMIGRSEKFLHVIGVAQKIAKMNITVLIYGESGTGKELLARFIHENSMRHKGPFIALNCSSIPDSLVESEFFGYAEGAFTGAKKGGQLGKFELAKGGTIFLDEIGDMPLSSQTALLRLLQEKVLYRIGDNEERKIDVRVIAATNKDLSKLVNVGLFRSDLYYRLKVVTISIPSLRERKEDIYELVDYFVKKACINMGVPMAEVDDDLYSYLIKYDWPGNIRELENVIYSMVALCKNCRITPDELPTEIMQTTQFNVLYSKNDILDETTKLTILDVLKKTRWKIAPAAKILGMGRTTLYRKLQEYNLIKN